MGVRFGRKGRPREFEASAPRAEVLRSGVLCRGRGAAARSLETGRGTSRDVSGRTTRGNSESTTAITARPERCKSIKRSY